MEVLVLLQIFLVMAANVISSSGSRRLEGAEPHAHLKVFDPLDLKVLKLSWC